MTKVDEGSKTLSAEDDALQARCMAVDCVCAFNASTAVPERNAYNLMTADLHYSL